MAGPSDADPIARARHAREAIAPLAERIEHERRMPREAVELLVASGAFKLLVPRDLGGADADASTYAAVLEEIARGDGSAGWCAMIGATSGLMSRFLPADVAREIYEAPEAVTSGVFAPMGRATPVDGGYRVSGRWPFGSGCEHASHRMGGAIVPGETLPSGAPDVRSFLFRADETKVIDTWSTSGLRGTGSHDVEVTDVVVPRERSFSLLTDRPRGDSLPFFGLLAAGVASVGLGIARSALDHAIDVARNKKPMGAQRAIASRESVQLDVARAEATLGSARAYLHDVLAKATDEQRAQGETSVRARALVRLASCHAAEQAADVTTTAWRLVGGGAIYTKSPMQRMFRDAHVVTQHVMVQSVVATTAGRVLCGLETDTTTL